MIQPLDILQTAISDVGHWQWWDSQFPDIFQVEFTAVQLWNPPIAEGQHPSNQIALRYKNPISVSFLRQRNIQSDIPDNWPQQLHDSAIEPFGISFESFFLCEPERIPSIMAQADFIDTVFGDHPKDIDFSQVGAFLAFWAGEVGLIVAADEMSVITRDGIVALHEIEPKYHQWWRYWREYWKAKKSGKPLPEDFACEVTVPLADESTRVDEGPSIYQCPNCGSQNREKRCPQCGTVWGSDAP